MKLHPAKSKAPGNRRWKGRRVLAALVTAAASGAGLLLATTGTAHAAPAGPPAGFYAYSTLVPASDWLNVAVPGASTTPGAPIIQWWATGGAEQEWRLPISYTTGEIVNQNSGMCITTDGVAGDQLYQAPCTSDPSQEWYAAYQYAGPTQYQNPATGLVMDVSGYDMWAGGAIDAWYPNGQANQYFWSSGPYS